MVTTPNGYPPVIWQLRNRALLLGELQALQDSGHSQGKFMVAIPQGENQVVVTALSIGFVDIARAQL